ncbi:hypothetical protein EV368DRAFT_10091, partial [Lentinula lateritia]
GSKAVAIKFIIPSSHTESIIGNTEDFHGCSGARLLTSDILLPGATEIILRETSVADAGHIATYYIGNDLIESR